jgi:outer membrane protein assembly factor BamE
MKCFLLLAIIYLAAGCSMIGDQTRRDEYLASHPITQFRDEISRGAIKVGMSKEEVIASWGQPCGYCYGTSQSSTGDSWEYNIFGTGSYGIGAGTYLFFDNRGILQYWSD